MSKSFDRQLPAVKLEQNKKTVMFVDDESDENDEEKDVNDVDEVRVTEVIDISCIFVL